MNNCIWLIYPSRFVDYYSHVLDHGEGLVEAAGKKVGRRKNKIEYRLGGKRVEIWMEVGWIQEEDWMELEEEVCA